MSDELKLCPFCGGAPKIETRDVEPQGDSWYGYKIETFVLCDCGACLFDGHFHEGFGFDKASAKAEAIAAWNLRPTPEQLGDARDAGETERMFREAVSDLAAIDEALGVDPDEAGGSEPIIAAIEELKAESAAWKEYAVHQEHCATCGEAVSDCETGSALRDKCAAMDRSALGREGS